MPGSHPAGRYRETEIRTANPLQLVVILYDGAIQSLREAAEQMQRGDIAARVRSINRALAMISELQASLSFEQGGGVAASLDRLYGYMKTQIFRANLERESRHLEEAVALLDNLNGAWRELARQAEASAPAARSARPGSAPAVPPQGADPLRSSLSISG